MRITVGRILESAEAGAGGIWPVVLIAAGRSKNGLTYAARVIREAVERGVFEGRPAGLYPYLRADGSPYQEHLLDGDLMGRAPRNVVGIFRNTRWSESLQAAVGDLHLSLGKVEADQLQSDLLAHKASGALDVLGLSIDALGDIGPGGQVRCIEACNEITVVTEPAAGGRFAAHRLAASVGSQITMFERILRMLRESYGAILGVFTGPETEAALERHIARRLTESEEVRTALLRVFEGHKSPKVKQWYGAAKARLKEGVDLMAALDDAAMLVSVIRDEVARREGGGGEGGAQPPAAPVQEGTRQPATPPATQPTAPAAQPQTGTQTATPPVTRQATPEEAQDMFRRMRESEANVQRLERELTPARLREAARAARLPDAVTTAMLADRQGQALSVDECTRIAEGHRSMLDAVISSGARQEAGLVEVTGDRADRLTEALAHMLAPSRIPLKEGRQPWMGSFHRYLELHFLPANSSIRESIAGGQGTRRRLRESVDTTNFDEVFADALSRAVLAEFKGHANFSVYEQLVRQVPYNDFRTHRVVHIGYYGSLPTVAKAGPYLALTTPTDREETIALAKKGGLEDITLEDMLNDDLQLWQTIVSRIGRAAMETRFEAVMTPIRKATQPTMADTFKLTDTGRTPANQLAVGLTADAAGKTAFLNAIKQMMQGTGGSGKIKGILPKFCVIPFGLLEAYAYVVNALSGGNTGTDVGQALMATIKASIPGAVIDYGASDANDWFLLADPNDAEVLRFANLGGRNEPEIFIADDERFGSMFTNDQIKLKVRDIFAVAAVDPTGIQGNVVT